MSDEQITQITAMSKLLAVAQDIVADCATDDAKDFDTSAWLQLWITQPHPALGGQKPANFLASPKGVEIVVQLIGVMRSGAYL